MLLLVRPNGMNLSLMAMAWIARASTLAPAGLVVTLVLAVLGYRLLMERARRRTLIKFSRSAPAGTILVQDEGPGGPASWLRVGDGSSAREA
jgi:hypothetical protein